MIQVAGAGDDARSGHFSVRPPRAIAWTLVVSSAVAIGVAGAVATAALFVQAGVRPSEAPARFWLASIVAAIATVVSLYIRAQRWVFLLRRSGTRIPIRDALIGYFSGLTLLIVPLLIGEMALRSYVQHARAGVRPATTILVNIWERVLDLAALALILSVVVIASGDLSRPVAAAYAAMIIAVLVQAGRTWLTAIAASVAAWLLPGFALWALARTWAPALDVASAQQVFTTASLSGALRLAPGGVLVAGPAMITQLAAFEIRLEHAVLTVFVFRAATAGIATALGAVFVAIHLRTRKAADGHFDEIAPAYDAQIPEARRLALLDKKTSLMAAALTKAAVGRRGLDVGCGQGWYVARMRELGFDVRGLDVAGGQLSAAAGHVRGTELVAFGSALDIPAADASYDFVYAINVLHHLASFDEQRRALGELARVLKPGGILFVHEINTRNLLFRLYMGYVFPTLNCIDEGNERWLLPNRLALYTPLPLREMAYFTFLPEFVPSFVVGLLRPIERLLERSPLRVYSAHYMAVLQKPA